MSRPKFMVFKLNDLKIPAILLLAVVTAFSIFMLSGNDDQATFAPETAYEDGMYVANLAFTDANLDLVVTVADNQITSIAFDGFDENERTLYTDLSESLSFVNDYVTSTQSVALPDNSNVTASTSILMDALSIALSTDDMASIETTYQTPLLEEVTSDATSTPADAVTDEASSIEEVITENTDEVVNEIAQTEEVTPVE